MSHLKIATELAVFSFLLVYASAKLNKPYPWNSTVLDYFEGIGVLTFIPSFLYCLAVGIWQL